MSYELPKNMKELLRHFPRSIPKEFKKDIEKKARYHTLYCYDKQDRQKAYCTCCGRVVIPYSEAYRYHHKTQATCPNCATTVHVHHTWRKGTYFPQPILSYHFAKSVKDPNIITCMAVYTYFIGYSDKPWKDKPFQVIDAYYVFVPGKGAVYAADDHKIYKQSIGLTRLGEPGYFWEITPHIRKTVKERDGVYSMSYGYSQVDIWEPSKQDMAEILKGTPIEYAWKAYMDNISSLTYFNVEKFIKLLENICRGPLAMEYLAKIGLGATIYNGLREGMGIGRAFNLKADTLNKALRGGISKEDKQYILKNGSDIRLEYLQTWQRARKMPGCLGISIKESIEKLKYKTDHELRCFKYVKYPKLLRYLEKQREKFPNTRFDIGLYSDYIEECVQLGADMKSKATLWPADLIKAHANQKAEIKDLEAKEKDKQYQQWRLKLEKQYSFSAMGFVIVVPEHVADLAREGTEMHHCVGTYIDRVARGDTYIVYVRRIDAIDEPFGTMEIEKSGKRILQVRGKFNEDLPPDAQAFVKAFEEAKIKKNKRSKVA